MVTAKVCVGSLQAKSIASALKQAIST